MSGCSTHVSDPVKTSLLTIPSVTMQDMGNYTCNATVHEQKSRTAMGKVIIYSKADMHLWPLSGLDLEFSFSFSSSWSLSFPQSTRF